VSAQTLGPSQCLSLAATPPARRRHSRVQLHVLLRVELRLVAVLEQAHQLVDAVLLLYWRVKKRERGCRQNKKSLLLSCAFLLFVCVGAGSLGEARRGALGWRAAAAPIASRPLSLAQAIAQSKRTLSCFLCVRPPSRAHTCMAPHPSARSTGRRSAMATGPALLLKGDRICSGVLKWRGGLRRKMGALRPTPGRSAARGFRSSSSLRGWSVRRARPVSSTAARRGKSRDEACYLSRYTETSWGAEGPRRKSGGATFGDADKGRGGAGGKKGPRALAVARFSLLPLLSIFLFPSCFARAGVKEKTTVSMGRTRGPQLT